MNLVYIAKMKVRKRKEGELRILITTISGRQVLFYTPDGPRPIACSLLPSPVPVTICTIGKASLLCKIWRLADQTKY